MRRKRKQTISIKALLLSAVILGCLGLTINVLSKITGAMADAAILSVLLSSAAIAYLHYARRQKLIQKITQIVNVNVDALVRQRAKLLLRDAYGALQSDRWHKEVSAFFTSKVIAHLTARQIVLLKAKNHEWITLVDNLVLSAEIANPVFSAHFLRICLLPNLRYFVRAN